MLFRDRSQPGNKTSPLSDAGMQLGSPAMPVGYTQSLQMTCWQSCDDDAAPAAPKDAALAGCTRQQLQAQEMQQHTYDRYGVSSLTAHGDLFLVKAIDRCRFSWRSKHYAGLLCTGAQATCVAQSIPSSLLWECALTSEGL